MCDFTAYLIAIMASDERAQRAAEVLRDTLVDLAGRTSSELYGRLDAICGPYTPAITGLGYPEIREAISRWRDLAADEVRAAFKRLLRLAKSPEAAKSVLWGGIDAAFKWSPPSRENSKSFDEWLERAGVDDIEGFRLRSIKCERYGKPSDQLNCDFRTLFELCIAQVAEELDQAEDEPRGAVLPTLPAYQRDPELDSKNPEILGRARTKLVIRVRKELETIRPDVERRTPIEKLAGEHTGFAIFQERVRGFLEAWYQKPKCHRAYSFEIAGQLGNYSKHTFERAWKKHHKNLDSEPTLSSD